MITLMIKGHIKKPKSIFLLMAAVSQLATLIVALCFQGVSLNSVYLHISQKLSKTSPHYRLSIHYRSLLQSFDLNGTIFSQQTTLLYFSYLHIIIPNDSDIDRGIY